MSTAPTNKASTSMNEHPLQYQWVLWENWRAKDYTSAMREVCEFGSIEEFWRNWEYIPKPSEIFCDGRREILGKPVEAFSLFKKGIRPEWEDKDNVGGCDLVTVKQIYSEVDTFWQNLVLALIGELIEEDNEICGARVLEKNRREKSGPGKNYYRIEVWMRSSPPDIVHKVKAKLPDVLVVDMGRNKLPLAEFDIKLRDKK